ncbi:MAG: ABC transporter substrate-binding protein [Balneolales bacterium]
MISLKKLFAFILICGISLQTVAAIQNSEAEQEIINLLEERDNQIKSLLGPEGTTYTEVQRQELTNIINDIIDYTAMAQKALQETYDTISQQEREKFVDLFSTIIRQNSLSQLDIYRAEVIYDDVVVQNDSAMVNTTAILESVRTPVYYEMERKGEEWVITDMAIDNVWTAESYRQSFQNQIRRRGFDALMTSLERRAERQQ